MKKTEDKEEEASMSCSLLHRSWEQILWRCPSVRLRHFQVSADRSLERNGIKSGMLMYPDDIPSAGVEADGYCCHFMHSPIHPWDWVRVLRTNCLEEIVYILAYWCIQMADPQFIDAYGYYCPSVRSSGHLGLGWARGWLLPSLGDTILQWRHNGHDSVSNHQPYDCLLNRLFRRRSKKTSKLRVTGLCAGNSPGTGEFPAQMASSAENVSIWWRHHEGNLLPLLASHSNSSVVVVLSFLLLIYLSDDIFDLYCLKQKHYWIENELKWNWSRYQARNSGLNYISSYELKAMNSVLKSSKLL